MSKRYYLFYAIIAILFLVQSNSVFPLDFWGFKPNLALYFTMALFFYNRKNILGPLVVLWLLFELSATVFFGFFAINLALIFTVLYYLDQKIPEFKWVAVLPSLAASHLFQLVFIYYGRQFSGTSVLDFFLRISLPEMILGTGFALLFFWLLISLFNTNTNPLSFEK